MCTSALYARHILTLAQALCPPQVHLVEPGSRRLVAALLVSADARLPPPSRTFELDMQRGSTAAKKIMYTNPYQQSR